ncbi:MAG TPA: VOC family protein [Thermoplasmata archaeon]
MVRTYGLTHVGLAVRDMERSLRFHERLLGVEVLYRDERSIQVQTPRSHDVIVFEQDRQKAGVPGGVSHIGFRLRDARDIEAAVEDAKAAGAKMLRRGEFVPGEPYVFVSDPDGYEVELWFELDAPPEKRAG